MTQEDPFIGKTFGKWTVLKFSYKNQHYQKFYFCRCECGTEKDVQLTQVINGYSLRCKKCADSERRIHDPIKIGGKYGKWTVIAFCEKDLSFVFAQCECGKTKRLIAASLLYGASLKCPSCRGRDGNIKHGHNRKGRVKPEYQAWCNMKNRCLNPNVKEYKNYGGRGILIHEPWINSYETFLADVGAKPSKDHSLERLDPNGHYKPGNVVWELRSKQVLNRRIMYEHNGQKISIRSLSIEYAIKPVMVKKLLYQANYSLEELDQYSKLSHFKKTQMGISLKKGEPLSIQNLKELPEAKPSLRHPLKSTFHSMMQRCSNPKNKDYHNYGGRGIKVHIHLQTFKGFLEYIEQNLGSKSPNSQLDRINPEGDYEPGNLRWSTSRVQAINKRGALKINGSTVSASEISEKYGLSAGAVVGLIKIGWNVEGIEFYAGLTFKQKKEKAILTKKTPQDVALKGI